MTNTVLDYAIMSMDSYSRGDRPDIPNLHEIYNRIDVILPQGAVVIIPENRWVENWTSPAFDALGERDEEIKIHGKPDPGNFEAG